MKYEYQKKNGDIFEISLLPYVDAYAYCQYISIKKYYPETDYPDLLRIYNFFHNEPGFQIDDIQAFKQNELLINPIYILGGAYIAKTWRKVGQSTPTDDEVHLPFERRNLDYDGNGPLTSDLTTIVNWGAEIPCFSAKNNEQYRYLQVKHLEFFALSYLSLSLRVVTAYFQMMGKDIRQELVLSEDDTFFADIFMDVTPYTKIPVEFRGIPVPESKIQNIYN